MQVKSYSVQFTLPTERGNQEKIEYRFVLEDGENLKEEVNKFREQAVLVCGRPSHEMYARRQELEYACDELTLKLTKLRNEWDATAEFLRKQGINPEAPNLPQFDKLLKAATGVEETVIAEFDDDEEEEYEED
jgi:hypothetical protein